MIDSTPGRVLVVLCLLAVQASLFPLYAQQPVDPAAHVYPEESEVASDPAAYVGDRVEITGFVQGTDPLVVRVDTVEGTATIRVVDHELSPEVGEKVRVFGTLTAADELRATDGFVVPQRGRWYAWGISFLAGLWVLGRLVTHWQVSPDTLGFRPRETSVRIREWVGRKGSSEEEGAP
jgi:hypothetical protein